MLLLGSVRGLSATVTELARMNIDGPDVGKDSLYPSVEGENIHSTVLLLLLCLSVRLLLI